MNNIKRHIILVSFILLSHLCYAQTIIKGQVTDEKGNSISDISIVITTTTVSPAETLGYAFTDENGYYNIQFRSKEKQIKVRLSGFNIQKIETTLPNRSTTFDQTVKEEAINLREVSVKAKKIWQQGDTLNYNVNSFMSDNDASIGEVLKKMPGISVNPSGTIEYKGKAISKFYIEGMDLLKGRYGIATNNIPPSSISTVQILENHQEVKALKNLEFPDVAAINLKLKDSAKGIFNLIAQLGLGTDKNMLWENELIGTYFTRKRQHFITYKDNNNGTDLAKELTSHADDSPLAINQFIQMEIPSPPGIELSKYYFNNTNATSVNNIWKLSGGNEINVNIVYMNDHEKRNSYEQTIYMMPDGSPNAIEEEMASASTINKLEGNISYNRNKENNYLANDVSFSSEWERGIGNIFNEQDINQSLKMKTFQASNALHWIRKKDEYKGIELESHTHFGIKPQKLYVRPCLFDDLFSGEDITGVQQKVTNTDFTSRNSISLLTAWMIGNIRISPAGIFNLRYSELRSKLSPIQTLEDTYNRKLQNNAHFYEIESGISANIDYKIKRVEITLFLPVKFNYNHLKQKKQDFTMNKSEVVAEPFSSIRYRINSHWETSASYNFNYGRPDMQNLYGGYILTNYRNLNSYEANIDKSVYQNTNLKINYKNVANMLFTGISVAHSQYKPRILHGYNMDGVLSRMIAHKTNKSGNIWYTGFRVSKGFSWKNLNLELESAWNKNESPQLRQEEVVCYLSQTAFVTGKANMTPFKWLSFDYQGTWQWNQSWIKNGGNFPISRTLTNKATTKATIVSGLIFSGTLDNYYNNQIEGNKSFTLVDMNLSYKWKNTVFTLMWNNIFDIKKYTYSYTSSMNKYYSEYRIRPTSIMLKIKFKIL